MIQQLHLWVYTKEVKAEMQRDVCTSVSLTKLFTMTKVGSNPRGH